VQPCANGHWVHSGDLGRQIVAPRSISAWAKSPGRPAGTIASVSLWISTRLGSFKSTQAGDDSNHIRIDGRYLLAERDRGDRGRRIFAQSRQ
jgi:hypothetical protein